ncbi:unnamed protein product [Fusarium graminearum]|uniref:Uncharacterized protein n=1 Tax=Gibberella zeae TaxID=5518 RepID=A0A4E9DEL6_GIBZA|nr:unnamed protein product [Fusarium graminearum]CAG1983637.1 unnamed protein product [Fusarium graminearum]CAG2015196.1 unnamed protein product [Fusarium graminearum]
MNRSQCECSPSIQNRVRYQVELANTHEEPRGTEGRSLDTYRRKQDKAVLGLFLVIPKILRCLTLTSRACQAVYNTLFFMPSLYTSYTVFATNRIHKTLYNGHVDVGYQLPTTTNQQTYYATVL